MDCSRLQNTHLSRVARGQLRKSQFAGSPICKACSLPFAGLVPHVAAVDVFHEMFLSLAGHRGRSHILKVHAGIGTRLTAPANYFNYFTEIEERFQQRRGSILLLSTLDWALIETWRDAGIPLDAVLRGIDAAFDKYEARQKRARMRKVNGLAWCAQAVMEASEELREASAGTANANPTEPRESGFEHDRVAAHLEATAGALDAAGIAAEACAATSARLRTLARAVLGDAGSSPEDLAASQNLEALERELTVLEEKLYGAVRTAAPVELLVRLKEHAARELAPYRSRMGVVQLRQVEQQFEQKQLLAHFNLPRLSLFYMSQQ